jgi:hypothetical protein
MLRADSPTKVRVRVWFREGRQSCWRARSNASRERLFSHIVIRAVEAVKQGLPATSQVTARDQYANVSTKKGTVVVSQSFVIYIASHEVKKVYSYDHVPDRETYVSFLSSSG